MTEPADEPDWNLLPGHPQEFFGLPSNFDQRALKRQYTSLIRRFKPEKFPLRFQQIRKAFEDLNQRFSAPSPSHGLPFRVVKITSDEIELTRSETVENQGGGFAAPSRPVNRSPTLLERVRRTPPGQLQIELRQSSFLNRDQRLLLTFLDDAQLDEPSVTFLDGLLAAARDHRDEQSWELLRQYLRSPEARARCAEILERIFIALASDEACSLTEPLWDELQQKAPFREFCRVLDDCVRHVTDHRVAQRLTFEIRLVRRTLFYADPAWISQRLAHLTKGDVAWPDWLDHQIWSVEQLVSYTKIRQKFLNGNRLRQMLDAVLQAHCQESPEFDRLYLEFQSYVLKHPEEVIAAFPKRDAAVLQVVWNVWHFLLEQVAYRFATHEFDVQDSLNALSLQFKKLHSASRPLLQSPRRWGPAIWSFVAALYLGFPLTFLVVIQGVLISSVEAAQRVDGEYLGLPVLGLIPAVFVHLIAALCDTPTSLRWRVYAGRMRQELFAFIRRHPLPPAMLIDRLKSHPIGNVQTDSLLAETQRDVALKVYATAAWILR